MTKSRRLTRILIFAILVLASEACDGRDSGRSAGTNSANAQGEKAADATKATLKLRSWAEILERQPDPTVVPGEEVRDQILRSGFPWRIRHIGTGVELVYIPPGEFVMGQSLGDHQSSTSERPSHRVHISEGFYISRTEITYRHWNALGLKDPSLASCLASFHADTRRATAIAKLQSEGLTREEAIAITGEPETVLNEAGDIPVHGVHGQPDALFVFLDSSGFCLPSEAQWEFACRAGTREARYGEIGAIAWIDGNTHEVGLLQPNAFGLHDMLGNVLEICCDSFHADAYAARIDGISDPLSSPGVDGKPRGPKIFLGTPIFSLTPQQQRELEAEAAQLEISIEEYQRRNDRKNRFRERSRIVRGGYDLQTCRSSWRDEYSLDSALATRTHGKQGDLRSVGPTVPIELVGFRVIRETAGIVVDWNSLQVKVFDSPMAPAVCPCER